MVRRAYREDIEKSTEADIKVSFNKETEDEVPRETVLHSEDTPLTLGRPGGGTDTEREEESENQKKKDNCISGNQDSCI